MYTTLRILALLAMLPLAEATTEAHVCDKANFRVVVDVGHSENAPGALSARGVNEYEFNMRLAKEIVQELQKAGFSKTELFITQSGPPVGLYKRAEYANNVPADLFISIHHDSVPDNFLERWEYNGKHLGFSDRFKGHSIFVSEDNGDHRGSLAFGHMLGIELKARGLKYTPHYAKEFMGAYRHELLDAEAGVYRYDHLVVLMKTRMPAVLFEAGPIINRDEELSLNSTERRGKISAAMTKAVEKFCASR